MLEYPDEVVPIDLSWHDIGATHDGPEAERQRYRIDLGVHSGKKLINSNRDADPAVKWRKRKDWQLTTRNAYDRGAQLDRAWLIVTVWTRTPSELFRDVQNVHYTTKGISDGLCPKVGEFDDEGNEINPAQVGWIPDDNDRIIIGPDLRRGLDPHLPKGSCRITVDVVELRPLEMAWWLKGAHYEQLQIGD